MADILRLQGKEPDTPATPGEEKLSTLSLTHCFGSGVSVLLCDTFRRL